MKHTWTGFVTAAAMAATMLPALPVQAADTVQVVVLGDNVAYAAGTATQEQGDASG